jgi:anaerobic magnesium-protoporphyrin IX monomethyl ester cyclase
MIHSQSIIGKTALILPPPWSPLNAPLGICTIGEVFRRNGIECRVFDWNIELLHELEQQYSETFNRELPLFWDSTHTSPCWSDPTFFEQPEGREIYLWIERRLGDLIANGYRTFGLSVYETNINIAKEIIQAIRQHLTDALILVGGPATNNLIEYKQKNKWLSDIDYLFYTEAEDSVTSLIQNFNGRTKRSTIPGTAYVVRQKYNTFPSLIRLMKRCIRFDMHRDYTMISTPHNQPTDVAIIPLINFDDLNLSFYKSDCLPIEFSRGCKRACSFCSETKRYHPYRPRPIDKLLQDMQLSVEKYGAEEVCLICSSLNGNKEHLTSFCEALISRNIKIRWGGNARLDTTLDAELLRLMFLSGCTNLNFGLESGSDHVLSLMNKQIKAQTASHIIEICGDLGIRVAINLIVGFPGETEEDFEQTLEFITKHHKIVSIFNVSKCFIDRQAPAGQHPELFGVLTYNDKIVAVDPNQSPGSIPPTIIPNGPHWSDWCTVNGNNTPYIRNQRYQKILDYIDKLGKRGNTPQDSKHSSDLTGLPH